MVKELSPQAEITGSNLSSTETQIPEGIPEYELEAGLKSLFERINQELEVKSTVVILIAGGSCSGKTTVVAQKTKEQFDPDVRILSMDDYYRGKTFMETQAKSGNPINWEQPEAVDLKLVRRHLERLKKGETIQKPVYNFKTSEPEEFENFEPSRVFIVEGLFALVDEIKEFGDIKVFIDTSKYVSLFRRMLRDNKRAGKKPRETVSYVRETVIPQYERLVRPTKLNADMIINNNKHNPRVVVK